MADTLDYFNRFYEPAKRHQRSMAGQWDQLEKAYLGEPGRSKPVGDDAWRSFLFYKYGYQQIQTLAAEVAADDDPTFVYEGRCAEQEEFADTASSLIGYQLQRDDYSTKRLMATITAAVYGGQPMKVHWEFSKTTRKVLKPSGLHEETDIILADRPTITLIDPRDFFYDVRARSMRECRYAFHRMRLTIEELEAKKRADGSSLYKNLDELRTIVSDSQYGDENQTLDNDFSGERDKERRRGIEVIEMWTRDRLIVRAAGGTIIRDEDNPYYHGRLPFEVATLQPSLNDVWGYPVMWLLRDVQEAIWTLDNAAMDQLKLAIDPPLAIDVSNDPDNINKPIRPRARFAVRTGDARTAVEPIRVNGAEQFTSQQAIEAARGQMKQITGITDELAGSSSADTATQAALNQRQSKGRISVMMRVIDASFARCAEMFLQLNQQYLNLADPIKLMGSCGEAEWRHIAPKEIAGIWDVRPKTGSERAVKELRRQNLIEGMNALLPMNGMVFPDGTTVDISSMARELAESFDLQDVVVPADKMYEQQLKQSVAQAHAQIVQQQMMQQSMPQQGVSPQQKLFESLNYKDLPPAAQSALLQQAGLPPDGVQDPRVNPTQQTPSNPIADGLLAFNKTQHTPQPGTQH